MRLQKGLDKNSNCEFTKLAINETSEWSQRELRILMQKEENAGNCENLQFSVEICKLCSYNFVLERLPLQEARLAELFFILFVSQGFYLG